MPLYHPRNKRNKKEKRNQIKENRLKKKRENQNKYKGSSIP